MTTTLRVALVAIALAACSNGDDPDGVDTLPKRGEMSTDPTIVSATAACSGDLMFKGLTIRVGATDAMGLSNLASCAVTVESTTKQGTFSDSGFCVTELMPTCAVGTEYLAAITIANETGGITTAQVKLPQAVP